MADKSLRQTHAQPAISSTSNTAEKAEKQPEKARETMFHTLNHG